MCNKKRYGKGKGDKVIYTSYFAKINKLPASVVPISIAAKPPAGYTGLQYKKLAPKYDFFVEWKRTHDNDHYIKCFKEQVLDGLTVSDVLKELKGLINDADKDVCLVCYEKPTDFCHRHLVAKWLNDNGIACVEYDYLS